MASERNETYYSYKTLMSYMNCFDPTDTTKFATFQEKAKIKLILVLPAYGICDKEGTTSYAYYKTPNTAMMQAFTLGLESLGDLEASIPESIQNFSIVYLDDMVPCPENADSANSEAAMDITAAAMIAQGCPVEFWVSKYSLLGQLAQIQTKAKDPSRDVAEKWIFSLSWGTYGLCDIIKRELNIFKVDIGQTCDAITLGCPSEAPCVLTNAEYINACELILKDLTENYNCIFFVSSGDTGPISSDVFTNLPYYLDYPTCSQYVISAGGINYTTQAPSNQSTSNPSAYAFAQSIDKNAVGFALPLTASERDANTPITVVGGLSDATGGIMASGGGFTGYSNNDTLQIKALSNQIPFLNEYITSTQLPAGYSPVWNSTAPQRGTPDISAAMSNGATITWGTPYAFKNADGTSFSSPLLAGFFALLLSYHDLPVGKQLIDFIYENPSCFDKPTTVGTNTFSNVNGFSSTTTNGTWDPCVGLGSPNFLKLYNALKLLGK